MRLISYFRRYQLDLVLTIIIAFASIILGLLIGLFDSALPSFLILIACVFLIVLFKKPEFLLFLWLILSPLLREYLNISGGGIPNITLDRIIIIPLFIYTLVVPLFKAKLVESDVSYYKDTMLNGLLVLYCTFELIGYLRGPWPITTSLQYFLDRSLLPIMVFWLARFFALKDQKGFPKNIIIGLIIIGFYSIIIEVLRRNGFESFIYPNGRTYIWDDVKNSRAVGELYNPAIFGAVLTISLGTFYFLTRYFKQKRWTVINILIISIYSWAIFITYTRSVWVIFLMSFVFAIFMGKYQLQKIWLFLLIILICLIIITSTLSISGTLQFRLFNFSNVDMRINQIGEYFSMFMIKPIFGFGAGMFDNLHVSTLSTNIGEVITSGIVSHNSILLILSDRGLSVFIPYLAILIIFFRRGRGLSRFKYREIQLIVKINWILWIAYFITAITIQVDYFPYFICLFWLVQGIICGITQREIALNQAIKNE